MYGKPYASMYVYIYISSYDYIVSYIGKHVYGKPKDYIATCWETHGKLELPRISIVKSLFKHSGYSFQIYLPVSATIYMIYSN